MTSAYRFRVTGRVQGVGFRQATQAQARALRLAGWVRNCADGSVEGQAAGSDEALRALRDWLRRGPPASRVETLDWAASEATDLPAEFSVRR